MLYWLFFSCISSQEKQTDSAQKEWGEPVSLLDYVDPMIATGGIGYAVNCGYPGANVPLGMVKISPDTATMGNSADGFYRGGGYHYDDQKIQGFSHMHLYATGITGHGVLASMPADGMDASKTNRDGYGMVFSHEKEWASVGSYEVHLEGVEVALTATTHTALHEYRFEERVEEPTILIDVAHAMGRGIVSGGEIHISEDLQHVEGTLIMDGELGKAFPVFFYGSFSQAAISVGTWQGAVLSDVRDQSQEEHQPVQREREHGYRFHFHASTILQVILVPVHHSLPSLQRTRVNGLDDHLLSPKTILREHEVPSTNIDEHFLLHNLQSTDSRWLIR